MSPTLVKRVLPGSAAARRRIPEGALLVAVNGEPTARVPFKQVQLMVSRAERPVRLEFESGPGAAA